MATNITLKLKRNTVTGWTGTTVLAEGEPGVELGTSTKLKIGDGVTSWSALNYIGNTSSAIGPTGSSYSDYLYWNGSNWVVGDTEVHIGANAGLTGQQANAIAIGNSAGYEIQGQGTIAIGIESGYSNQQFAAIAIGKRAGKTTQQEYAVAIGQAAGYSSQQTQSVAIGFLAGFENQGTGSVAIGPNAGQTNQPANSIVLNASGGVLVPGFTGSFFVNPIRNDTAAAPGATYKVLYYNTSTNEIVWN